MIQRSHPLVGFGRILFRHHTLPLPLNYAFREWRVNQNLSTPTFSWTQHPILHWKMAISQSSTLMTQAWVRMSQCPSFKRKPHWSRKGSISLKIEERTFIGASGCLMKPLRKSDFTPLERGSLSWKQSTTLCRWKAFSKYSSVTENNSLPKWETTHTNSNIFIKPLLGSSESMTTFPALLPHFGGDNPKWVGHDFIGSTVPVPWRLIKADSNFF